MSHNSIPIVQGAEVGYHTASPASTVPGYAVAPDGTANNTNGMGVPFMDWDDRKLYSTEELRQQRQDPPKQYKDVVWAFLFVTQLATSIGACLYFIANGNANVQQNGETSIANAFGGVFTIVLVCGSLAVGLACASLKFMLKNAELLVQAALFFSVATSFFMGIIGFMAGNLIMGVIGMVAGAIGCCYAYFVWHRIPFAAVNLQTALQAIKSNMGLLAVALAVSGVAMAWSILWFLGLGQALGSQSLFVAFLLFVNYYWTHEVLRNTVHVTTAGVVGTWWYVPSEANSHFSPALMDSWSRATSYSFGSICFGSFLVALIRSLRAIERHARGNDDLNALACVIQCILACIESIIEYFNQWAYVYVALYGMSYIEAGRNVLNLFAQKGWTVIITDDLADNVLFMMSIGIALFSGLVGWIMGTASPDLLAGLGWSDSAGPAFLLAFIVGLLLSSILLGVVNSAINCVIVCYADAPADLQMNEPELSASMRTAWTQAWPGLLN